MRSVITMIVCAGVLFFTPAWAHNDSYVFGADSIELINNNTVWRYYDGETDPVKSGSRTAWTCFGFDVSEWKTSKGSKAIFGSKNGELKAIGSYKPEVLLNQYKTGTNDNIETYFFRTNFTIKDIPEDYVLRGQIYYDDAALIYLNGQLIAEFDNKQKDDPDRKFDCNMQYGGHGDDVTAGRFQIDADKLNEGKNILAVELHQVSKSSSDVYFNMSSAKLIPFTPEQKNVVLNVGADENSRNLVWYYNEKTPGTVQYAVKNGDAFPSKYKTAKAVSSKAKRDYFYSNKAVMTGLKPDTEYVYRLVNKNKTSDVYTFRTTPDGDFSFFAVGDPQIGNSMISKDSQPWKLTLSKAVGEYPDAAFLLSAGDQVDSSSNEAHYDGFIENETMKSLPVATSIGNHDNGSVIYSQHFNNPNVTAYGKTTAGSDYWFMYNNTLFMNMNSNSNDIDEHREFIKEAIEQNPEAVWKVVTFHHSLYSAANHADSSTVLKKRELYVPMLEEFDIDIVFMGHDHVYVRTYIMDGFTPIITNEVESSVREPEGILYMTLNSSSGSKFYGVDGEFDYSAVQFQENIPNFAYVEVTDESFTIKIHRVDDKLSIADQFTVFNENAGPLSIEEMTALLEYNECVYNGTERKPAVTIEGLSEDNYDVAYRNNKYPGKATVTIKGKGDYAGTITADFVIKPKAVKNVKVELSAGRTIRAAWEGAAGADGYRIYAKRGEKPWSFYKIVNDGTSVDLKKMYSGSKYKVKVVPYVSVNGKKVDGKAKISKQVYTLKQVKTKDFKKTKSGVSVRWYNINGETGYQIARATAKNGKYIVIRTVKSDKANYNVLKAKKGKTYYYKIRAYKQVGSKKITAPWSEPVKYSRR